jgi:hypothetical protein
MVVPYDGHSAEFQHCAVHERPAASAPVGRVVALPAQNPLNAHDAPSGQNPYAGLWRVGCRPVSGTHPHHSRISTHLHTIDSYLVLPLVTGRVLSCLQRNGAVALRIVSRRPTPDAQEETDRPRDTQHICHCSGVRAA